MVVREETACVWTQRESEYGILQTPRGVWRDHTDADGVFTGANTLEL